MLSTVGYHGLIGSVTNCLYKQKVILSLSEQTQSIMWTLSEVLSTMNFIGATEVNFTREDDGWGEHILN